MVIDRADLDRRGRVSGIACRGIGCTSALGRGLVRPLDEICNVMDDLATGDLGVEVPFVERRNEIGQYLTQPGRFSRIG